MAVLAAGLAVAGSSPAAVAQGSTQQSVAQRCFEHHKFGAQPVDVAKTADGQTVLAQTNWNWHDAIGCYLTLDDTALTTLRTNAAGTTTQPDSDDGTTDSDDGTDDTTDATEAPGVLTFGGREVLAQQAVGVEGTTVSHGTVSVSVPAGTLDSPANVAIHEPLGEVDGEVGGEIISVNHQGLVQAPITVQWDVSHLSDSQQQKLVLTRWDEELEDWIPGNASHDIVDGVLTAEIQEWSFWTWLTKAVRAVQDAFDPPWEGYSCGIRTDHSVACWGWVPKQPSTTQNIWHAGYENAPSGEFKDISANKFIWCQLTGPPETMRCFFFIAGGTLVSVAGPQAADTPGGHSGSLGGGQPGDALRLLIDDVKVAGRPGQLAVSWSPLDDGALAIDEYEVSYWGPGEAMYSHSVRSSTSAALITGLTNRTGSGRHRSAPPAEQSTHREPQHPPKPPLLP